MGSERQTSASAPSGAAAYWGVISPLSAMSVPITVQTVYGRPPRDRLHVDRRWAWHYQTLVALRDHLVQEQQAPQSTDGFDRDFIRALLARESDPLGEINAAIERILRGDYGCCEVTGLRIAS